MRRFSLVGLILFGTAMSVGADVPRFGPAVPVDFLPPGGLAMSLSAGDLNRDKRVDLLVLDPFASEVAIRLGETGGIPLTGPAWVLKNPIFKGARSLSVVDVNQDGVNDILVAGQEGVAALLGGSYKEFLSVNVPLPSEVFAADLNEDGAVDLVALSNNGSVYVALAKDNQGHFKNPEGIVLKGLPQRMAVGDFNGDRHLDIAVLVRGAETSFVTIFPGTGKGDLKDDGPSLTVPNDANELEAGDLNGDGITDLVTSGSAQGLIFLFGAKESGWKRSNFSSPVLRLPRGLALGDFDGDGHLDVATTSQGKEDTLFIVLNDGEGKFSLGAEWVFSLGSFGHVPAGRNPLIGVDIDLDGDLDIVSAADRPHVILMRNRTK